MTDSSDRARSTVPINPYGAPVLGPESPYTRENQQERDIENRNNQREMGRRIKERAGILDFSPAAELEDDPLLAITGLRYPIDMAGRTDYQHVMRICIYKQIKSRFNSSKDTVLGGRVSENEFGLYANRSRSSYMDINTELATGTKVVGAVLQTAAGALGTLATRGIGGTGGAVAGNSLEAIKTIGATAVINQLDEFTTMRSTEEKPCAYVTLYMPETMQIVDRHDYDAVSFTEASGLAGLYSVLVGGGTTAGEIPATVGASAGIFGKGAVDAALYSNGYALNPMLEVLYKGTKNREFVFSFKFVPRGADEAETILAILRTLRFHASPEYDPTSVNSRYFIPPSDFDIEFFIGAERNLAMPRIAKCVLSNVDVNYAPSGQYSTHEDGVPTEITCQMTFTETVVLTKEDIKIGY